MSLGKPTFLTPKHDPRELLGEIPWGNSNVVRLAAENQWSLPLTRLGGWQSQADKEYSGLSRDSEEVLDDLIGVRGMSRPTRKELENYVSFLIREKGGKWNLRKLVREVRTNPILKVTDLGTVCDVTILSSTPDLQHSRLKILEIGGGYGRLIQSMIGNTNLVEEATLVDVMPSSMFMAEAYLRKSEISTSGAFLGPSTFAAECPRVSVINASQIESVPDSSIDLVLNVESFQEMTPEWVSHWTQVINKKTKPGSIFFHSNSFDFKNFFDLDLGQEWFLQSSIEHPRHWTKSHRTEIWKRGM